MNILFRPMLKERFHYLVIPPFSGVIQGRVLEVVRHIDIGMVFRQQRDKFVVPAS